MSSQNVLEPISFRIPPESFDCLRCCRACFNVQLITICAVVNRNVQCKMLHCQLADYQVCAVVDSAWNVLCTAVGVNLDCLAIQIRDVSHPGPQLGNQWARRSRLVKPIRMADVDTL